MAIFTAAAGGGDMTFAFLWEITGIGDIEGGGASANVLMVSGQPALYTYMVYTGSGLGNATSNVPSTGSFTGFTLTRNNVEQGTMTFVTRPNNFAEIDSVIEAYRILDGNDILTGAIGQADVLTGGFGGNDSFLGRGGNDEYIVGTVNNARPTHVFTGSPIGFDTVTVTQSVSDTSARSLDMTLATFSSIEKLKIDESTTVSIDAAQFGPGIASNAAIEGEVKSTLIVQMFAAGTLDLRGLSVTGANMVLAGSAGGDIIFGTAVGASLLGNSGVDVLNGGPGSDLLVGGLGRDLMTGGPGLDVFDFDSSLEIGKKKAERDTITDFEKGLDRIDLSGIDAKEKKPGDQLFKFLKHGGAEFTEKAGQLHWYKVNKPGTAHDLTRVEGDTDGNGKADFKLELSGLYKLTAADFVL